MERLSREGSGRINHAFDVVELVSARRWIENAAKAFGQVDRPVNPIGEGCRVNMMDDTDEALHTFFEI